MDGRQKTNPQPEIENDRNDDEIIDLTQIVEGGNDDDIIDLTDILKAPEQAAESAVESEDVTILLEDAIYAEETADLSVDTDDEVIDLMDVATTLEADMAEPAPYSPESDGDTLMADEEALIDLLDVAVSDMPEKNSMAPLASDEAEDVIDLLDAVEPEAEAAVDNEFAELESRAETLLAGNMEPESQSGGEPFTVDTLGEVAQSAGTDMAIMNLDEDEAITDNGSTPAPDAPEPAAGAPFVPVAPPERPADAPVSLTEAQVEAALERAIEKLYGEKIEQLMIQTIEKTIQREIEKIKIALLEDSDGMAG